MREIKFRAWDKTINQMHEVIIIDFSSKKIQTHPDYVHTLTFNNCELMQFTGLKDKNGIEIYEGDIIKILMAEDDNYKKVFENFKIIWHNESCRFKAVDNDGDEWGFNDIEVIGNIYANPELLK